eukprot:scaffold2707_cov417-Prasinococcus_capsulatus_cf.AAC.2
MQRELARAEAHAVVSPRSVATPTTPRPALFRVLPSLRHPRRRIACAVPPGQPPEERPVAVVAPCCGIARLPFPTPHAPYLRPVGRGRNISCRFRTKIHREERFQPWTKHEMVTSPSPVSHKAPRPPLEPSCTAAGGCRGVAASTTVWYLRIMPALLQGWLVTYCTEF